MGEAGGRRVVAEPLPHVVAVEALPDGRKVMRLRRPRDPEGDRLRHRRDARRRSRPRVSLPDRRANELLESLLDAEQLASWRTDGTFWVESRRGPVQLGRLYSLLHHPVDRPDEEVVLCVVPEGHGTLPRRHLGRTSSSSSPPVPTRSSTSRMSSGSVGVPILPISRPDAAARSATLPACASSLRSSSHHPARRCRRIGGARRRHVRPAAAEAPEQLHVDRSLPRARPRRRRAVHWTGTTATPRWSRAATTTRSTSRT